MGVKDTANLALIPAAYKTSKVYSALPTDGDGDFTFTRTGSGTRINKAGLIETMGSNVPRLNYRLDADGNVSSCPELLLEPERTNQFTHSEDLSYIDYKNPSGIITDDIISPNGSLTADKALQSTGDYFRETVSVSNGTTYSFSVFLKKGDLRYAILRSLFSINGVTPANSNCIFDLDSGSVVYTGTDVVSASIEAYANDWYRCSFVSVASTTNSAPFIDFYFTSSSSSTQSAGVEGYGYAWGMQLEAGDYSTSYIPTDTSAETRNKDEAKLTPFVDMANDYPVTVYAKAKIDAVGNTVFSLNNTSSQNYYLLFYFPNSTQVSVGRGTLSANDFDNYNFSYLVGDILKIVVVFISETAYKLYINGIEIANLSSGTSIPFNHDDISVGQLRITGDTGTRNSADELFIWNKALTDAEMVEVTSYTSFTEMAKALLYTIE